MTYTSPKIILAMAEAALSPYAAWRFQEPMAKTWPEMAMNPNDAAAFYARNPAVRSLIWC